MATSIRTMLTASGYSFSGAIYQQPGVWLPPKPGSQRVDTTTAVPPVGTNITAVNSALDKRIVTAFDCPRVMAFDSNNAWVLVAVSNQVPKFVRILNGGAVSQITSGTYQIPIITDIDQANWAGYQGVI